MLFAGAESPSTSKRDMSHAWILPVQCAGAEMRCGPPSCVLACASLVVLLRTCIAVHFMAPSVSVLDGVSVCVAAGQIRKTKRPLLQSLLRLWMTS